MPSSAVGVVIVVVAVAVVVVVVVAAAARFSHTSRNRLGRATGGASGQVREGTDNI